MQREETKKIALPSGIRLILERVPAFGTASVGIFVEAGTRYENPAEMGISHFIEHMNFKGTNKRDAKSIAYDFDRIGGRSNAFTGKEYTVYYAKTLDYHVPDALDILGDMLTNSCYDDECIAPERKVVLEEYLMYEDSPEDLVIDKLCEKIWDGNGLGMNILGNEESITSFSTGLCRRFVDENYTTGNTVIAVSGNYDEKKVIEAVENHFSGLRASRVRREYESPMYKKSISLIEKDVEQNHICLVFPGIAFGDDENYPLLIANNILGDGMSSRLFQRLREELGLVYSVYTFLNSHRDVGLFGVYLALNPRGEDTALAIIMDELEEIRRNGLTDDELVRSKELIKTNLIMGLESTYSRMSHLAKSELMGTVVRSQQDMASLVDRVTKDDVLESIRSVTDPAAMSVSVVGSPRDEKDYTGFSFE